MFSTISDKYIIFFFFYIRSLSNYTLCRVTTPVQTIPSEIWHSEHERRTSHTSVQHRPYVPCAYIRSFRGLFDGQWTFFKNWIPRNSRTFFPWHSKKPLRKTKPKIYADRIYFRPYLSTRIPRGQWMYLIAIIDGRALYGEIKFAVHCII